MQKLIKKWWIWAILVFILISIIGIKIFITRPIETSEDIDKNTSTINTATLTYPELRYFLEEQGYSFVTHTSLDGTVNDTFFYNNEIYVTATLLVKDYKYIIQYQDKKLNNSEICCITDTSANTSEEKQQQYNSYLKWKEDIGLTQEQIKEVLIKYYLENE